MIKLVDTEIQKKSIKLQKVQIFYCPDCFAIW